MNEIVETTKRLCKERLRKKFGDQFMVFGHIEDVIDGIDKYDIMVEIRNKELIQEDIEREKVMHELRGTTMKELYGNFGKFEV